MRTAAPCYEYGTAVERMWCPAFSKHQYKILIYRTIGKHAQNSLICEHERSWWIFFEYRAHFLVMFLYKRK